jgi:hypothetical protein
MSKNTHRLHRTALAAATIVLLGLSAATPVSAATPGSQPRATSSCNPNSSSGWKLIKDHKVVGSFTQETSGDDPGSLNNRDKTLIIARAISESMTAERAGGVAVKAVITGYSYKGRNAGDDAVNLKRATTRATWIRDYIAETLPAGSGVSYIVQGKLKRTGSDLSRRIVTVKTYRCGDVTIVKCTEGATGSDVTGFSFAEAVASSPRSAGLKPLDAGAFKASMTALANKIKSAASTAPGGSVNLLITGYASAEGNDSSNTWLAKERGEVLEKHIKAALRPLKLRSGSVTYTLVPGTDRKGAIGEITIRTCP